jgi:diguanylate cyclase (GGDEF)-like protein/PAS domain S-box-containing protein
LLSRLDGVKWVEMRCTAIDWQGQPATLNSLSDITERRRTEQQLQLAASVFTHAREGIMITDADGAIIDVNDTFTRITGFTRQEALGENPRILNSGRHDAEFYVELWRSLIDKGHWYGEIWNRRKNGEIFAEMQTISAVYDAEGQTQHYVALFSDITLIKEHEQQLEHIAHYDALTSLPNRVLLADRLHQAMSQAQRRQQALAVVYLDLDGFKAINDCHGHDVGDQLLMLLARRMRDTLRDGDTLARLGGDEFVAVLLDLNHAADSASLLGRLLAATAQPVPVSGHLLQVSASLGVTFYPQREDVDADQLMRQADQAMYQAKLAGKNRYHIFDAEQDIYIKGQHESLDRIRRALSEGEFVLYYQPKVNMRLGTVIGAEALIRWQHPDKGLLSPASFLPMIEGHPLAVSVGEWVLDAALGQMARWQAMGLTLPVSVNLGARQLQQMDFVIRLRQILARHPQVSPSQLELEILETSALEDLAEVSQVIAACRDMGVNFALDDFGTGYSSLTYLKHLQVALLKIDQSFVRDMLDDPDDLAILSGVIGLAAAFRRDVMAEGVETIEHGAMLLQLGCERAQGYGIAHPMPADAFPDWAAHWQADPLWRRLPPLNRDDLPLLFAITELRAWMTALEHYLHKARDLPPVLDAQHSRFGHWLASEGERRHGQHPLFVAIRQQHQQLYAQGQLLCQYCLAGNASAALAQLDAMHQQKHALLDALKALAAELGG